MTSNIEHNHNNRNLAQDSSKVRKFRQKLEKFYSDQDKKITQTAKQRMISKIELWISDNVKDRIPVQKKGCSLFDDNTNSAPISRSAEKIRKKIQQGYFTSIQDPQSGA